MKCCKSKHCCKNKINSSYMKWLLELLGPVLIGSKPCEIISIPNHDINKKNKLEKIEKYFEYCKKVTYKIIEKESSLKVLFINSDALKKKLKCKKCQNFLKYLGYPQDVDTLSYLDFLMSKLQSENFPDEIGVFLGYPIKDVVGFMGYGKNISYSTKYWRVYGDPKPSEELYTKFLNHRQKIRDLIYNRSIESIISTFC